MLITLSFFNGFFTNPRKVYGSAILFTGVFAALGGLNTFGFDLGALQTIWVILPFASVGMEWVVSAAAGTALGILLSKTNRQQQDSAKKMDVKASLQRKTRLLNSLVFLFLHFIIQAVSSILNINSRYLVESFHKPRTLCLIP